MVSLQRTSRFFKADLACFKSSAYSLDKLLLHFLEPQSIHHFLTMQAHSGAVIAGSVVLKFFKRHRLDNNTLTLYVHHSFHTMVASFLSYAGYSEACPTHPSSLTGSRSYPADGAIAADCNNHGGTIARICKFSKEHRTIELALITGDILSTIFDFQTSRFHIFICSE
jgi:hypothetical protein